MDELECRVIPGYEGYTVSNDGRVFSIERKIELSRYLLNGYWIVDAFRGSLTETLPVHRAVALAWVENPNPNQFNVVNHKDGIPTNNCHTNLEWTDMSGNNYHAVNTGLRTDNIQCRVRDFLSAEVLEFASIAQAAVHMGLPKDTPMCRLSLKKFGALINDRFEFRFADDLTPWFYQDRTQRVVPSRYLVEITEPDGTKKELYTAKGLLKTYQLYKSGVHSIPELVQSAIAKFPDHTFLLRDSYTEVKHRTRRSTRPSRRMAIRAVKGNIERGFVSLTSCAMDFGVDRSSITNRLNNDKTLDGWSFIA